MGKINDGVKKKNKQWRLKTGKIIKKRTATAKKKVLTPMISTAKTDEPDWNNQLISGGGKKNNLTATAKEIHWRCLRRWRMNLNKITYKRQRKEKQLLTTTAKKRRNKEITNGDGEEKGEEKTAEYNKRTRRRRKRNGGKKTNGDEKNSGIQKN